MFSVIDRDWVLCVIRCEHAHQVSIFISTFRRQSTHRLVFDTTAAKEEAKIANRFHQPSDFRAREAVFVPKVSVTG